MMIIWVLTHQGFSNNIHFTTVICWSVDVTVGSKAVEI